MNKFLNWVTIILIISFVYQLLAYFINPLPPIPFGEWTLLPTLATVVVGIIVQQTIETRQISDILFGGSIADSISIMAALERTNPLLCKRIMVYNYKGLKERIEELEVITDSCRQYAIQQFQKGVKYSFDVSREQHELSSRKRLLNVYHSVFSGNATWADVVNCYIENICDNGVLKYLLDDLDPEKKEDIEKKAEVFKTMRQGGAKVTIK